MRKQFVTTGICAFLTACSTQPSVNHAPLDMKTVEAYQARVYSGNTIADKYKTKEVKPEEQILNASDHEQKKVIYRESTPRIMVVPSIGYSRGWY